MNNAVFRSRRNSASDEAALTDAGKVFQARAAATGKARSPSVTRLVIASKDGTRAAVEAITVWKPPAGSRF